MKRIRDGLHGDFISLIRAVEAIGARIEISNEEVDRRLGVVVESTARSESKKAVTEQMLNAFVSVARDVGFSVAVREPKVEERGGLKDDAGSTDFHLIARRSYLRKRIQQSRGAGKLLHVLNRPTETCPQWHDASCAYPIVEPGVRLTGMKALVELSRAELNLSSDLPSGMNAIAFDRDELIRFLDVNGIPHILGLPLDRPRATREAEAMILARPSSGSVSQTVHVDSTEPLKESPRRRFNGDIGALIASAVLEATGFEAHDLEAAIRAARPAAVRRKVLDVLSRIAESVPPPSPLVGLEGTGKGVLWKSFRKIRKGETGPLGEKPGEEAWMVDTLGLEELRQRFK